MTADLDYALSFSPTRLALFISSITMFATGGWFGIVTMAIACHHTRTACHATLSPVAPLGPTAMNWAFVYGTFLCFMVLSTTAFPTEIGRWVCARTSAFSDASSTGFATG